MDEDVTRKHAKINSKTAEKPRSREDLEAWERRKTELEKAHGDEWRRKARMEAASLRAQVKNTTGQVVDGGLEQRLYNQLVEGRKNDFFKERDEQREQSAGQGGEANKGIEKYVQTQDHGQGHRPDYASLKEATKASQQVEANKQAEKDRISEHGLDARAANRAAQNIPDRNRYAELKQEGARNELNIPENLVGVDRPQPIDPRERLTSREVQRLDHQQKNEARHRGEALDRMVKCQEQGKPVEVKEFNHLYRDEVAKLRTNGAQELSSMIAERQRQHTNERER